MGCKLQERQMQIFGQEREKRNSIAMLTDGNPIVRPISYRKAESYADFIVVHVQRLDKQQQSQNPTLQAFAYGFLSMQCKRQLIIRICNVSTSIFLVILLTAP